MVELTETLIDFILKFQKYIENVKQDTNIGTNILRVSASDEDADNNGAIRYSITAPVDPTDLDYFDIQPESGWIYLRKPLDVSQSTKIQIRSVHRVYIQYAPYPMMGEIFCLPGIF